MSDDDPLFISESHRQTIARNSERNRTFEGMSWRWPVVKGRVAPAGNDRATQVSLRVRIKD